ncbi:MAG: hypothetical protein NTW46_01910, partial [Candidatus Nealsonbacteria bacterium]|nr:hypothetical protein [Candidatus Nealsonbacteria bacterium]
MTKKIFLAFILFSGIFLFILPAKAMLTPQIYFTDLKLEKETFKPGEEIKGSVSLWNYEQFLAPDLFLFSGLMTDKDKGTNVYKTTIDWEKDNNGFMLLAGEKVQKDFNYILPLNLPSGKMEFKIWVANSMGAVFSFVSKEINIEGNNNFLTLINKSSNGISFPISIPLEKDPIKIFYSIKNNSESSVNVFPIITLWKKNIGGEMVKEEKKDQIALKPKEEKSLTFDLVEPAEPYFSLIEMRLYDNNNQPLSNSIYINPLRSFSGNRAEILNASCDKDIYSAGEIANVKIQFSGVSGLSDQSAGQAKIAVKITDNKSGDVAGSKEEEVNSSGGETVVSFPVNKSVSDFKVESSILYNEKVLAEYSFNVVFREPAPQSQGLGNNNIYLIILVALIVLFAMIFFIYLIKKRRTFLLFLIFASITFLYFSSNSASAVTQVISDCHDTIFSWGAPAAGQTYKAGGTVNFTGSVTMNLGFAHGFQNVIHHNIRFRFYVAKDMNIAYAECCARDLRYPNVYTSINTCGSTLPNPSGPSPNSCASWRPYACRAACVTGFYMDATKFTMDHYLLSLYCGQYKVVGNGGITAENPANYRKLGEVISYTESGEYSMSYNETYTIPTDIGFTGPFRFYVDFEAFGLDMDEATSGRCLIVPGGSLCGYNWFWGIYYQPELNLNPPTPSV